MYVPENTKTAGLIRCHACGVEQPEYDKFCRQCGASHRLNIAGVAGGMDWSAGKTRPLLSTKTLRFVLGRAGQFGDSGRVSASLIAACQSLDNAVSQHAGRRSTLVNDRAALATGCLCCGASHCEAGMNSCSEREDDQCA